MTFEKIICPNCRKRLFDADSKTSGVIIAYCKRCKKQVLITLPVTGNGVKSSCR